MSRLEMLTDSLVETEHFQKNVVLPYFKDIYKDLASRSENPDKGIEKFTILQYCELPGVYGDRFFAILDTDGSGFIELKEFLVGLFRVYCSDFETNMKLAFEFYDFDKDGYICEEDVSLVLSYADINAKDEEELKTDKHGRRRSQSPSNHNFEDRLANQVEIAKITEKMFSKKEKMNYEEFKEFNTNESSETILCVLKSLKTHIPCTDNFYKYLKDYRADINVKSNSPPIDVKSSPIAGSRATTFKATSPTSVDMKKKTFLFTAAKNIKNEKGATYIKDLVGEKSTNADSVNITKEEAEENILKNATKLKNPKQLRKERLLRQATIKDSDIDAQLDSKAIRRQNVVKLNEEEKKEAVTVVGEIQSPTGFLSHKKDVGRICVCGRNDVEEGKDYCPDCLDNSTKESINGYMYRKTKDKSRIKKYFYRVIGHEMYSYKNEETKSHKTMHSMLGVYITEEPSEKMADSAGKSLSLYPIKLVFPHKYRMYYFLEKEERSEWVKALRDAAGYRSVGDFYDVSKKVLGKGKFGIVKLATHKKSGKEVAIKAVSKTEMSPEDLELQRNEIEILKVCQHPSIIRLLDIFENETDIYLVMEYMKGGDLFDYLQRRDFTVPESLACNFAHQIATAIFYLHSYGVAHRDLKPENIIVSDDSESPEIKITDFGLSKIVGPKETSKEPFGTLSYAAPEILQGMPYNKAVDVWSFGIILFLILSGCLPFDDDDDKLTAHNTVYKDPDLYGDHMKGVSKDAIDLIKQCLEKKPNDRVKIMKVLEHKWFSKANKELSDLRKASENAGQAFKAYTSTLNYKSEEESD
jgi:Ca2+-binding EF-hand superfamily protein